MSRNRYTNLVHKIDRAQDAYREEELAVLTSELRCKVAAPATAPVVDDSKRHRRSRLEQRQQHKPERFRAAGTDQP